MDEEVVIDLFNRAKSKGYTKSIEDFKLLLETDEDVVLDNFNYVKSKGYTKSIDDFKTLVKKKDETTELVSPQEEVVTTSVTEEVETPGVSDVSVSESIVEKPDKVSSTTETEPLDPKVAEFLGVEVKENQTQEKPTLVERALGKNEFTDFLGDTYRSIRKGVAEPVESSIDLYVAGNEISDKKLEKYIEAVNYTESLGESDEMRDFQKTYEEEGSGIFGVLKGLYENPSIAPQVLISSISSMARPTVLASGLGGLAIGNLPGAIAASTAVLETSLTFNELLREELQGQEFNKENIRKILSDPDKLKELRVRSGLRGAAIGIVEGITGGLAGKVTTKVATGTGSKVLGATAGVTTEVIGGSTGEVAGKLAADQEMDVADIVLEGIAGTTTAPLSVGGAFIEDRSAINRSAKINEILDENPATYEVNGQQVSKEFMLDAINNMTDEDISSSSAKINIKNDPETYKLLEERLKKYEIANKPKEVVEETTATEESTIESLEKEKETLKKEGDNLVKKYDELVSQGKDVEASDYFEKNLQPKRDRIEQINDEINKINQQTLEKTPTTEVTEEVEINKDDITTNTTVETNRIKELDVTAEDGQTFNLDGTTYEGGGLVVPVMSVNTNQSEITSEKISDFVEENQNKIGDAGVVKVGIYKFPGSDQVSIDLNIVVPSENRDVALEFGRLAGQESLFDLETFENVKTGSDGKNPLSFTEEQFKEIAKSLKDNKLPNVFETATTEVTEEVVEEKPSKERVDNIVEEIITKVRNRRGGKDTNPEVILEATKGYLQGSKLYEEATDIERESSVRQINEKLGIKIPKAPSVKKILRKPKKKKVVVDEMAALKDQIKLEARAARGAVKDVNTRRKELAKQVKELQKKGKITSNQARVITNKISSVNLYNPKSVDGFVKYMEKVYDNAEYANKVLSANALRKRIKKGSKNKKKDAKLTDLAKSFSDIDPKFIDNIDEYLKVANSVLQGVVSSRVVGTDVNWRTSPDIVKVDNYINSELEKQREIILENKKQEFETITGIAASELSYDDMMAILESPKEIDENKEKLVRDNIGKVFNAYKSIINNIISTGKDPFTGEKIDTPNKKIIKEFMDMDLNDLTVKESIQAVDALNNYVTNGITSGMETVVSIYRGARNTKKLTDKGIKAKPLRLFGSKSVGRFMGEQLTSLPILFERVFKGIDRSRMVMNAIGFNDITSGVSKARKISNVDIDTYVNKFSKTKPNGKAFNDAYNITERGIIAFMRRTLIGDGLESKVEFDRRKSLIEQSIDKLEVGSTREQEKAKEYREVYDAVVKDANSIQDVEKNANKTNLDAVKWWNEKWASYYDELSDVSLNVYNKLLGSDINYIPDSYRRLEDKKLEDFEWNESAFASAQDALYQKKTGILEEATRPKKLPKDRYISLDFDTNNASLLEAALIDIKTAAPIQQLKGSIESKYFNKLVPTKEDRSLLIDRLKGYVRRVRGKDFVGGSTAQDVNRLVNFLAGIGVSRVLGGLTQPVKQTLPVAANTLINAGRLDLSIITNSEVNKWLDQSGYAIANRGLASETTLESINRALEKAAKSKGRQLFQGIEKLNRFWLQSFLVKPDAFIARASWISYYKQSLKRQGLKSDDIDWSTHKINKKAADYAQQQVDRQQNVSDADLQGDVMTSKKPGVQITRKVLIPFMNFILNQKARMYSDMITISSKTSSSKDKKSALRSIGGLLAETAVFNALSYIIGNILYNGALAFTGQDESEEDKKKRRKKKEKGVITNIAKDVLVPLPIVDEPIIGGLNMFLDKVQADLPDSVEKFNLYNYQSDKYLDGFGVLGIGGQKLLQTAEIAEMASSGTYTTEFMNVKTKKKLPPESIELMQSLLPIAILYNSGLLPSEVGSEINYIVKILKKTGGKIEEADLNEIGLLEGIPLE